MIKLLILISMILGPLTLVGQVVRINELATSNKKSVVDDYGEYEDWIELYNPSRNQVDVSGWYISDRYDNPLKWRIPDHDLKATSMPPDSYLVLWADKNPEQGPLHLGFKLSREGEGIYLFYPKGGELILIDSVSFEALPDDKSFGLCQGEKLEWRVLKIPTPGLLNICQEKRNPASKKKPAKGRLF